MRIQKWLLTTSVLAGAAILVVTAGCQPNTTPAGGNHGSAGETQSKSGASKETAHGTNSAVGADHAGANHADADGEHGHQDGQHGGIIVSLGEDSYHVEAVVAADGSVRLFTLGKDESRVIDIESQILKGYIKAEGAAEAQEMSFEPTPQEGDTANRTSLFVGKLPAGLVGQALDLTIPNIRIDGERFRLGFRTKQTQNHEPSDMPAKVADSAESELYLTPGGHYTAADIAANGNVTASQKFKGIKSDHNMNPKPGDIICPISGTKANPKFAWVIGGKTYLVCCPPCLDEFLTKAKTSADPLPDPESFIKK